METKKFSLVTYLIENEYGKVRGLQERLSELTGSTKCLTDWQPHITVGDGLEVTAEQLSEIENKLQKFAERQQTIVTKITGFGGIDNWKGAVEGKITPYIIWLDVEVSAELLKLWTELRDTVTAHYLAWLPRSQNYVPHVTLAFADLTEEGYEKGMEYLAKESFESPLTVSHVALVECYGVGNMTSREYKQFPFLG